MNYDDLIRRAQLWATGATIHNVKQLTGSIEAGVYALAKNKKMTANSIRRQWCEPWVVRMAAILEAWMSHGDYKRAWKDHPEPEKEAALYARLKD